MNRPAAPLACRTDARRGKVRAARLGGVDGVEAGDDGRTLTVTFLGKAPHGVGPANVRIDGGRRITGLRAERVTVEREEDAELDDRMHVLLDRTGDTTRYRLSLVAEGPDGRPGTEPYPGFDQRYHGAGFTFTAGGPTPFDCAEPEPCAPGGTFAASPVADYTARDFDTLRQLVLDRLALTAPDWQERSPADLGTTLVEILAHTADRISYAQDAVATEAYLDTARRRVSVRRHARLIDHPMHDGCNARAFVTLEVAAPLVLEPGTFRFAAVDHRTPGLHEPPAPGTVLDEDALAALEENGAAEVFEPLGTLPLRLDPAHNAIRLWTWGDEQCFLPRGATGATLCDAWADERCETRVLGLRPGDLLLLEEVRGPRSGDPGDADPAHRQVVRLTSVTEDIDRLEGQPVLEVAWAEEDALTFPLVLSSVGGPGCDTLTHLSLARGNTLLTDHGRTLTHDGTPPETVQLPYGSAVLPVCEGDGCEGGQDGNGPARLADALLRQSARGGLLTAQDVHELHGVFGPGATARSGIGLTNAGLRGERVHPPAVHGQAAALRTLLARSVYPGTAERPRPRAERPGVTQAAPYPDPRHLAAGQAARLAALPDAVRGRLAELWRSARDHDGLGEDEIAELTALFGTGTLERLALRTHPEQALRALLHRSHSLLAAKLRRLEILTARAAAGTVLDGRTAWEIARTWGPRYAGHLHPQDPALHGPAAGCAPDPRRALPALTADDGTHRWYPRRDLLGSSPADRHFTGELEDDGRLALRFGDGRHGAAPPSGARLALHYRLGGGRAGNVGAGAIGHLVLGRGTGDGAPSVAAVRNPLPATGGTEPEPLDQVRQSAPLDLARTRLRAVTTDDYADLASAVPGVQRAAAVFRWTGSVQEVHVAVDALTGDGTPPPGLLDRVAARLEPLRRIGHDVFVVPARQVPLDLALHICPAPGHRTGRILTDLRRVLGSRGHGFFHPGRRTFGQPVRLSRLVAAAVSVPGVDGAEVTRMRRQFQPDRGELAAGVLRIGPLETAQCEMDPRRPENGRLTITLAGGDR